MLFILSVALCFPYHSLCWLFFFFSFVLFSFSFCATALSGPKASYLPCLLALCSSLGATVLQSLQVAATNVFDTPQVRLSCWLTVCLSHSPPLSLIPSLSLELSLCRSNTSRCLSIASGCQHFVVAPAHWK